MWKQMQIKLQSFGSKSHGLGKTQRQASEPAAISPLLPAEIGARMAREGQTQLSELQERCEGSRQHVSCVVTPITDLRAERLRHRKVHRPQNVPLFLCLLHVIYCNGPRRMKDRASTTNARALQNYQLHCRLWTPNGSKGYQELEKWLGSCPLSQPSQQQTNPPFLPFFAQRR